MTLNITGGPLAEGSYRLTILSAGINDSVNALDGGLTGGASDYVRDFIVDKTAPSMFVTPVSPNPRNNGVNPLSVVFNEAVTGVGLADVRLTREWRPQSAQRLARLQLDRRAELAARGRHGPGAR